MKKNLKSKSTNTKRSTGTWHYSFVQEEGLPWLVQLVKNPPANAGGAREVGSIPGSGRSPEEGTCTILQYSCLENSVDRGAW